MSTYPIPEPSLRRLQRAYADFEQLATLIAEGMGVPTSGPYRLDLPNRVFVVDQVPDGLVPVEEEDDRG